MKKNKKELLLFYVLAFLFSWLLWVPQALSDSDILRIPESILRLSSFGAFGPIVSAICLTLFYNGKTGLKKLLLSALNFRFKYVWYFAIFLIFPIILGASLIFAGTPLSNLLAETNPVVLFVGFFIVFFTAGPLQEEFGWRGYALDRLQQNWNALTSSIIIGLLWGLWHLPLFYMDRADSYYNGPILGLLASTILISILFTWIYNNTNKSIMAMLLFHTMWNYSHWILPTLESEKASGYMMGFLVAIVLVVILYFKPKNLRLDYKN